MVAIFIYIILKGKKQKETGPKMRYEKELKNAYLFINIYILKCVYEWEYRCSSKKKRGGERKRGGKKGRKEGEYLSFRYNSNMP